MLQNYLVRKRPLSLSPQKGLRQLNQIIPRYNDVADAALWVGGIPDHVVAEGDRAAGARLRALFAPFGEIVSVTVRAKPGVLLPGFHHQLL